MKFTIILLVIATSIFHKVYAQNKKESTRTRFGIRAGYNYIATSNVPSAGTSNMNGFHAGVFASGKEDFVNASADLIFSKQGYQYNNGKVKMNYLTTTETADFFLVEDVFKLQVGVHIGYLLSAKADSSGIAFNASGKKETDYFNRFTFGIAGGAEFITEPGVLFGIRYTIGINNINKKSGSNVALPPFLPAASASGLKSNILQLYAGFRF